MATTDGTLYLTALRSLEKLEIQFVPSDIVTNRRPFIGGVSVIGRNNPLHHYTGGLSTMTLNLDFHAEDTNMEDVIRKCKWLESLAYSDGNDNPPERIKPTFGRLFRAHEIYIVTAVQVTMSRWSSENGWLPRQAYVKLTLALDPDRNLKTEDVQWRS